MASPTSSADDMAEVIPFFSSARTIINIHSTNGNSSHGVRKKVFFNIVGFSFLIALYINVQIPRQTAKQRVINHISTPINSDMTKSKRQPIK